MGTGAGALRVVPDSRASQLTLFGLHLTSPYVNVSAALLLGLAAVGFAALARAAAAACGEARRSHLFLRTLSSRAHRNHDEYVVFEETAVQAFCASLLRPRAYVSTGAVQTLSAHQLDAVLGS